MTISRSHRTALFVEVSADSSSDFRERTARLAESLNGSNIKTDIYSKDVATGRVSAGLNFPVAASFGSSDVLELAREAGYTQALVSTQTA